MYILWGKKKLGLVKILRFWTYFGKQNSTLGSVLPLCNVLTNIWSNWTIAEALQVDLIKREDGGDQDIRMIDDWWRWRSWLRPFKFMYQAEDSFPLPLIFSEEENWAQIVNQYSDWSRQTFFLLERLQEGHCLVNWTITERSWGVLVDYPSNNWEAKGLPKTGPHTTISKRISFTGFLRLSSKKWLSVPSD